MTGKGITRRRALTILAGGAGALALGGAASRAEVHEWRGTALGADARIVIANRSAEDARRLIGLALGEIERLEATFSLHRVDSELVRLNREGLLDAPSHDMRVLLGRSLGYFERTNGAFNPAIQPLWQFLAAHFAATPECEPEAGEIASRLALCQAEMIETGDGAIRLAPGMALTFNGIAQGYVTDRVCSLLASEGVDDILLGLGELRALPGRTWQVEIAGTQLTVPLSGRAIATSAGAGTPFTDDLRWHHLIDPHSGHAAHCFRSVTVLADSAAEADALSTAMSVSDKADPVSMVDEFAGTAAFAVQHDGHVLQASSQTGAAGRG